MISICNFISNHLFDFVQISGLLFLITICLKDIHSKTKKNKRPRRLSPEPLRHINCRCVLKTITQESRMKNLQELKTLVEEDALLTKKEQLELINKLIESQDLVRVDVASLIDDYEKLESHEWWSFPHPIFLMANEIDQLHKLNKKLFPFADQIERQIEWSKKTFGPSLRTKGIIDHIKKELIEVEKDPHDVSEWIDIYFLALDGAWRHGATPQQIIETIQAKQLKNENRVWPDWRTMPEDKAIEHDRSDEIIQVVQNPIVAETISALINHQKQLDADGAFVGVPRQAVEEAIEILQKLTP